MKMKEKTLEVFTVPEDKLLCHLILIEGVDRLLFDGEIKEVRLIHCGENLTDAAKAWLDEIGYDLADVDDVIQFIVCSPKMQPAELAELKAKQEAAILARLAKARRGEISYIEACELAKKERDSSDFKDFYIEANYIFLIHKKRWPRVGQKIKITKAELTDDGVEFTIVKT